MATTAAPHLVGQRLEALRNLMGGQGLDLYLIPTADEHLEEYLPPHKLRRQAITGFSGSAGDAVVTREQAHLFVDSRYHLQAEQEVDSRLFRIHKLGLAGEQELQGWLEVHDREHGPLRVGYDPFVFSMQAVGRLAGVLKRKESALVPVPGNLVDRVWPERSEPPRRPVYRLEDGLVGEILSEKLARVRKAMEQAGVTTLVLTRLDEVAWLTNLRGSDVPHNPVFEAYVLVERAAATCFTDNPLTGEARTSLEGLVRVEPYGHFPQALQALAGTGGAVWMDPSGTTAGTRLWVGEVPVYDQTASPVVGFKAIKNPVEIQASREAHIRAGCAKVRSFVTLETWIQEGRAVSEADYAALLYEEYAREEGFTELSFNTIAAFGENGAIVHYGTPDPETQVRPGGLLLVDSGVQIRGATTDDTRTIAIGEPTETQRLRFTDVLRGHIRLAMQVFPEGTAGQMLDALARSPLWNAGLDYGHGTGHGVGAFLHVHEGPQTLSPRGVVPLEPGMVVSNEPGYYREGWGGIRCENLYVVEEALGLPPHPAGKRWLRLSPLTLIPFDHRLIAWNRLMEEERQWLTAYHALVADTLAPRLEAPYAQWLQRACAPPP